MAKRTIKQTLAALPDAPSGTPNSSAQSRRESAARRISGRYGDVLEAIAALAFDAATEPGTRLRALAALASYLYPQMKAIEVSGPDGERLTVEVRRLAPDSAPQGPAGGEPGKD